MQKFSRINGLLTNSLEEPDDAKKRLGLSAQEVMAVLPEAAFSLTNSDSGEEYYSIHYEKLTALLVEGIKEQQKQIEELQAILALNSLGLVGSEPSVLGDAWLTVKIKEVLNSFGLILENGMASLQKVVTNIIQTDEIKIGSQEKPTGITIYDKLTGEPYCVFVEGGQMKTVVGECSSVASEPSIPVD